MLRAYATKGIYCNTQKELTVLFTLKNVKYKNILTYSDIKIPESLTTFISGESGTGKTTLLKLLNGVLSPSAGEIDYLDKTLESYDPILLRREILLVSQSVYLFDKSIKDNFDDYYSYRGMDALTEDEIRKYLEICSINIPLDSMCNILSGGERQRVFIAINLSFKPKVLMMDEPTSSLDDKNSNEIMQKIKEHCHENKITLIVVSHDKLIAEKFADNIVVLDSVKMEVEDND